MENPDPLPTPCLETAADPPLPEHEVPATPKRSIRQSTAIETQTWTEWVAMWKDALTYPVRGDALYLLIPGSLLAVFFAVGSGFGFAASVTFIGIGWFGSYHIGIMEHALNGDSHSVDWPDYSDLVDCIVWPGLAAVVSVVVGLGLHWMLDASLKPTLDWICIAVAVDQPAWLVSHHGRFQPLEWPADFLALSYASFSWLQYLEHGTLAAVIPHRVIAALARVWKPFLFNVLLFFLIVLALGKLANMLGAISLFYLAGLALGSFYLFTLHARLMGLFWLHHRVVARLVG